MIEQPKAKTKAEKKFDTDALNAVAKELTKARKAGVMGY